MRELFERTWDVYREFTATAGPFVLFGLFEREEAAGRWDLVVSTDWARDAPEREAQDIRKRFFAEIQAHLGPELVVSLSRVVLLAPEEAFVRSLGAVRVKEGRLQVLGSVRVDGRLGVEDHWVEFRDCTLHGMHFNHVILFEYNPDIAAVREPAAAPA